MLDRLLFIFFAEDCGLLPPNSMVQIIDQWEKLKEMDEYRPFYDRVKKYFGYMKRITGRFFDPKVIAVSRGLREGKWVKDQ